MKRSEMVATIALEIAKQGVINDIDDLTWLNVDYVLKAIESKGMKPPLSRNFPRGGLSDHESEEVGRAERLYFTWDKE